MSTKPLTSIGDIGRQGDLYIERIADLPTDTQEVKAKDARVLAYGESGTHHHEVVGDVVIHERPSAEALVTADDATDLRERFLRVERDAMLKIAHDERRHEPIHLEPGVYRTWIQRVWSPDAIQRVYD